MKTTTDSVVVPQTKQWIFAKLNRHSYGIASAVEDKDKTTMIGTVEPVMIRNSMGGWTLCREETKSNAILLAAAPDLLAALKVAEAWMNNLHVEMRDDGKADMEIISSAIAKATRQ